MIKFASKHLHEAACVLLLAPCRRGAFLILAGVIAGVLLSGPVTHAFAHAGLANAVPAPAAILSDAPAAVTLTFTEALEPEFSTIEVRDAKGARLDKADTHATPDDRKQIVVDLKPLPPGPYTVLWRATSVDTHRSNGTYPFTVKP